MMPRSTLDRYARSGNTTVDGWLHPTAIDILRTIFHAQDAAGLRGAMCEIGVHHGRLFIMLCLAASSGEQAIAYDLFARQDENVDGSGRGDLQILLRNLERHQCDRSRVKAVQINSLTLDADRVIADCGSRPRAFSIDGGHTAEVTCHDLATAHRAICRGGVIILDDFFNEQWPGVAEGAYRYMTSQPGGLIPIAIAGNKVLFTDDAEWAENYKRSLEGLKRKYFTKTSLLFGYEVVVLWSEPGNRGAQIRSSLRAWYRRLIPLSVRAGVRRLLGR